MRFKQATIGAFTVLRVLDRLTTDSNTAVLVDAVEKAVSHGHKNIAFCFTANSYLSTRSISAIVQCIGIIEKVDGKLVVVHPSEDIRDSLETTGLDRLVRIAGSEEELDA